MANAGTLDDATVVLDDLHVTYRVYEDRRPRLREVVAKRGRRPSFREIHAVKGVDLVARQGESIGLIGHNGSGKSTMMQAVAGLLPATSGAVYASSQPSLLGVSAALQPNASGRRNIVLGGLALGLDRETVQAKIPDIIKFTGLAESIDLPLRTYSSGMKARLNFAIATSVEPEILLIDEALSVGDETFKRRSGKRIKELRAKAGTIFLVSHSLSSITDTCTRCIWLHQGELRADGAPKAVVEEYRASVRDE